MHGTSDEAIYLGWDIESWRPALDYWSNLLTDTVHGRALEVGAREGRLSLWLAREGFGVDCTDIFDPSDIARPFHHEHESRSEVLQRIRYAQLDATQPIEVEGAGYDVVVFKSVLGGIGAAHGQPGQAQALINICNALRPGGTLLFAENLSGSPALQYLRRRFTDWGASWLYPHKGELLGMLEPLGATELCTTGLFATMGRSEKQRQVVARFDRKLVSHVPESWRYIGYGSVTTP